MNFHVYKERKLLFKGESNLNFPQLMNHLIKTHSLGFDDKVRIEKCGFPFWFRVIGASVNGKTIPYLPIDLNNPTEVGL